MLMTHTHQIRPVRPVVAPPSSIASTLAALTFLYHGSLAATLAAAKQAKK